MSVGELRYLAAALVLHLSVPVAAAIAPAPERTLTGVSRPRVSEIDVDISALRPPTSRRDLPPELPIGMARAATIPPADPTATPPPPPERVLTSPTSTPAAEAPFEMAQPDQTEPLPTLPVPDGYERPPDGTGPSSGPWLPGQPWSPSDLAPMQSLPAPVAAPTSIGKRRETDPQIASKVIDRTMRAKDRQLNLSLPAASKIASVVRGVVSGSSTPSACQAILSVLLGGDGRVQGVSLVSFSGGDAALWQSIRRSASAQLAGMQFPVRSSYAKGAVITVSIRSELRTPSGNGGLDGASVSFDPTNIGAKASRQVTSSFSVQAIE